MNVAELIKILQKLPLDMKVKVPYISTNWWDEDHTVTYEDLYENEIEYRYNFKLKNTDKNLEGSNKIDDNGLICVPNKNQLDVIDKINDNYITFNIEAFLF